MKDTLVDEDGVQLTEITSRPGRSPGQMLIDWAMRPDALFKHYFDRGRRDVTVVTGMTRCSAVLATRWQMGARFWFLEVNPVEDAPPTPRARRAAESGLVATRSAILFAEEASAAHSFPAGAPTTAPRVSAT
jgi:hypothetical protein